MSSSITRRGFLKNAGLLGATMSLAGLARCKSAAKTPVALQLYTVRDLAREDWQGTVEKVAEIGYDAVEFAGYGGLSAKEVRKILDDTGLLVAGTHEGFNAMANQTDERIEYNLGIGNKNIVVPSMPREWREEGADKIKAFAEELNKIGEKVKAAGMQLFYHNHSFEFETKFDGKTLYELLFSTAEPELVKAEVDVAWVKRGGYEPSEIIRTWKDRVRMLHMKDAKIGEEYKLTPVGLGDIDMQAIIQAAREVGVEWFIVEQDRTERPVLEAIQISLENMRRLLG